jgi:hypothetical protein
VLEAQVPGASDGHAGLQPERRLMLTVLKDALAAFRKHALAADAHGRRAFRETEEWFASDDVGWPFSFANICEELGLDAEDMRAGLWRWRADQAKAEGSPLDWLRRFRAHQRAGGPARRR